MIGQQISKDLNNNSETSKIISKEPPTLPVVESKYTKFLNRSLKKIEERKPKNLGSIFDKKKVYVKIVNTRDNISAVSDFYNKKINKEKREYNVFSNEDNIVKELMLKFRDNKEKDKIPKIIRKKMAFERLYDITDKSKEKVKNIRKNKKLYSLEKYQEKIMKTIDPRTMEQSEILTLVQNLKDLKKESNNVKALPPINFRSIKAHVMNRKANETKKKSFKEIMNTNIEDLDEYEKEQKMIRRIKDKSPPRTKRNTSLDLMPEYIRDIFSKK